MKKSYIAENIRIYRERANLTQQELADRVGISWEMISRYERSESSPFQKLDSISKALNVSKSLLLERHVPERYNLMEYKIPLFLHLPSCNRFTPNQTHYFYNCPEWIIKKDIHSIALDSSLVNSNLSEYRKNGVLYISTQITPKRNDLIILKDGSELLLTKSNGNTYTNILGKVLAQEIRY